MPSGSGKWIRPVKDNPAGKVVADPEGNRWQWQADEETARLLKKLQNDDLAIEQTDVRPHPFDGRAADSKAASTGANAPTKPLKKPPARDAGGGFNPYDHSGKPPRRR